MQILGMANNWQLVKKGEYIYLPKVRHKKVVFQVNSEAETKLRYYPIVEYEEPDNNGELINVPSPDPDSKGTFFCKFDGLDKLEFGMPTAVAVMADKDFYVRTRAGKMVMKRKASETFTQIADRQQTNPNMEAVIQKSKENAILMAQVIREQQERSLEQQRRADALEHRLNSYEQKAKENPVVPNEPQSAGNPSDAQEASQQEPNDGVQTPAEPSEPAGEGDATKTDA